MDENYQLHSLNDEQRALALERFRVLRPALEENVSLSAIAQRTSIKLRTLQRWRKSYLDDGLAGLARKPRRDRGQFRTSNQFREAIEGLALKRPPLSAAAIARRAKDVASELNEEPPSYQSVLRIIERIDPALRHLAHQGSNGYSDRYDLIHRTEAPRPNAIWQADHTQLDILVDNNQKPWLTVILDDYSRAVAGYALSLNAPSIIQTALAYRQAIWVKNRAGWPVSGIPEILYTDHGSDFTSNHLEQVAADLKTQLVFSAVGRPRGRGKIERFFRSINQVLLTRLPGYSPPSKTIEEQKRKARMPKPNAVLKLSELTQEVERYFVDEYNITPHSANGTPPVDRWLDGGFLPRMPDSLEQLDLLLLTVAKARAVHPDGIRFSGFRYIAPTLAGYIGESVVVRYDPRDLAEIRVFHDNQFVCRAVCQELAGVTVGLREIVNARSQRRRDLNRQIKDRIRTVDTLLKAHREPADNPLPSELVEISSRNPVVENNLKLYEND